MPGLGRDGLAILDFASRHCRVPTSYPRLQTHTCMGIVLRMGLWYLTAAVSKGRQHGASSQQHTPDRSITLDKSGLVEELEGSSALSSLHC